MKWKKDYTLILAGAIACLLIQWCADRAWGFEGVISNAEQYNKRMVDTNKQWDGVDNNACWAAALTNMLSFVSDASDEETKTIYEIFRNIIVSKGLQNEGYGLYQGFDAFLKATGDTTTPVYVFLQLFKASPATGLQMMGAMLKGEAVALNFTYYDSKGTEQYHVFTIYGVEFINVNTYRMIFVDSDDHYNGARQTIVTIKDSQWYFKYEGLDCYFNGVYVMKSGEGQ